MTWIRYCLYYLFSNKKHFRVIQGNWLNIIFIQMLFRWLISDVLFPLHLSIHTKHILSITVWLSTQEITLNFDWFSPTKLYRVNSIRNDLKVIKVEKFKNFWIKVLFSTYMWKMFCLTANRQGNVTVNSFFLF